MAYPVAPALWLGETHGQLDEMHLGVVRLVVNEMVASRAVPAGLDRGAARRVTGR